MACKAHGQGTIKVVERTTPVINAAMMASFTEWHMPKSSALMISRRVSAGYPSNRLDSGEVPLFINFWHIVNQALGVSLFGAQNHRVGSAASNKSAALHNVDLVRNVIGQANIMGDENNRHPDVVAQFHQLIQNGG